jgi:hypothetical protein
MKDKNPKQAWIEYCNSEIDAVGKILDTYKITLDADQPHISGERYLMQAVTTTSGKKLILLGKNADGIRVVIKATRDTAGKREIEHERTCRTLLKDIDFAGEVFHTPRELLHCMHGDLLIVATEFIEQESTFLERPLEEQFTLALTAFKAQESAHATTWGHLKRIKKVFEVRNAATYLHNFATFNANIQTALPHETALHSALSVGYTLLQENKEIIEQYTGFLTHTDFVPHNIRVQNKTIYLLDHSSLTFGNKYEGWARFLNFMTLYNPALETALTTYVQINRTPEESTALRMMRIYRLGEIIWYYVRATKKSEGDLRTLNLARVQFWKTVLEYISKNEQVPSSVLHAYTSTRDSLRSDDEKQRQQGLH